MYRKYADEIKELKDLERSLKIYTEHAFFEAMERFGFKPVTPYTNVKGKHFIPDEEYFIAKGLAYPDNLRFYIWWDEFLTGQVISIYFEVYGQESEAGLGVRRRLQSEYTPGAGFLIGSGEGSDYCHVLVSPKLLIENPGGHLADAIAAVLKSIFFNDEFNVVEKCAIWTREVIRELNS